VVSKAPGREWSEVRDPTLARNYAGALFELAERHSAHDEYMRSATLLAQVLESDRRVRQFLETPKIDTRAKQRALRQALAGLMPELFINFLLVVLAKRRQRLLPDIAHEYAALLDEKLGRLHVQVTLAHRPDPDAVARIAGELSRILGRTAIPHVHVDPAIIGGIVVRYGDQIMDGSIRRRLMSLRSRLLDAVLPQPVQE
jgi:F-type H+-transporting ATPase subunit delta